jgi:hypothetical protein
MIIEPASGTFVCGGYLTCKVLAEIARGNEINCRVTNSRMLPVKNTG